MIRKDTRLRRLGCLAVAAVALAGCATTNAVTLRSHHYHLDVPRGWQVIEAGGDGVLPTFLRIPADRGAGIVDIRLFTWVVEGPFDPTAESLARLAATGVIGPAGATTGPSPCPERNAGFFVFGRPARAVQLETADGQRLVVTAGYKHGSLVGIVAGTRSERPPCADVDALHAAIERLAAALAPGADLTRPVTPPTVLEDPAGRTIELPPPALNPSP